MSLWKYKYFVDVVDCKSFTKAGKKNYVSQTAISQQIADLEKKVGGKLLFREHGILKLTELGEIVYVRAKEMLLINSKLEKEIDNYKKKYVIKIGIDNSINKLIWKRMQKMIDTYYTEEDFQFTKIDESIGTTLLEDGSLDIYIGYEVNEIDAKEEIESFSITDNNVGIYVGKDSTIPLKDNVTLDSLKEYKRYATAKYPCSVIKSSNSEFEENCGRIRYVDNLETMKLKVEFNDGYAFVDSHYFSDCSGEIYQVEEISIPQHIKVFYKKKNHTKKKISDVLEKIQEIMEMPL